MTTPAEPLEAASISVVIPTFNDVVRLGDALASVAAQTLRPAEVVVADDGSSDGTENFVRDFAQRRAGAIPIRYVRLAARSGVVAARNEGIALAGGEWIATCDSDDVWAPGKLERQLRFIREWRGSRPIALLGTHGYNINDAKRVISLASMGPTSEQEYLSIRMRGGLFYVIHSSAFYARADYVAVGGYSTEYGAADDYHFFSLMAERGVVLNIAEPLVYYRKRAGSVQLARFWDQRQGVWRLAENERRRASGRRALSRDEFAAQLAAAPLRARLRRRKQALGMYYYRAGATHMANGQRLRGAALLLLASALDWPRLRAGAAAALRMRRRRANAATATPASDEQTEPATNPARLSPG